MDRSVRHGLGREAVMQGPDVQVSQSGHQWSSGEEHESGDARRVRTRTHPDGPGREESDSHHKRLVALRT